MIRRSGKKIRKKDNSGSSFVLVIVATTLMCVLASALLMGAYMTYKLKTYKLNSINNFYELERAMDEIYAGIGASVNEHLYSAYTSTAAVAVVYDTEKKQYTTIDDGANSANQMFKRMFMENFMDDKNYRNLSGLSKTLRSFISNEYDEDNNKNGVDLDTSNLQIVYTYKYTEASGSVTTFTQKKYYAEGYNGQPSAQSVWTPTTPTGNVLNELEISSITFKNVGVKRTYESSETYVQSICTDIVLTQPDYNVDFEAAGDAGTDTYDFAIMADMGVEVSPSDNAENVDVSIKGNIYAASDYYNKDYNDNDETNVTDEETQVTTKYTDTPTTKWGTTNNSVYSGLFIDGKNTKLTLSSDIVVCAGTLAAYDGATINLSGRTQNISELWTDSIVIGGEEGGSISAAADAYVFDDTELNAEKSELTFTQGRYFGYSYNADDTRNIDYLKTKGYLATNYTLRSHFSDSAIIVNGKDSTLDLERLSSLYIAGKSYVEFSKIAASSLSDEDTGVTVDKNADFAYTTLKDYSTGQSLDVKTNQLIFLTQWSVEEGTEKTNPDTGITTVTLKFPQTFEADDKILDLYDEFLTEVGTNEHQLTAIKQEVSGHEYYYLYIDGGKDASGMSKSEKFAEKYYDLIASYGSKMTSGLYNVRNYENFDVKLILPDSENIKTGAAVTAQNEDGSLFYRASTENTTMNVYNCLENAASNQTFSTMLGNQENEGYKDTLSNLQSDASKLSGYSGFSLTEQASSLLAYMYINMKDHLSVVNKTDDTGADINAWSLVGYTDNGGYTYSYDADSDKYSYDYSITPVNNYVNFTKIIKNRVEINETISVENSSQNKVDRIIVSFGDVTVKADQSGESDGSVQGIIIAAGDVTFDSSVKSFRGMIITGSKLILRHDIDITADQSYVASLLSKAASYTDTNSTKQENVRSLVKASDSAGTSWLDKPLVLTYVSATDEQTKEGSGEVSISDISYEDILLFQNWKKNLE